MDNLTLDEREKLKSEWQTLKTKTKVPNGRFNKDTILLRVLDK